MKKLIVMLFFLVMLTGCSEKSRREVNILNWSSYIPGEVILEFERETGINVNYGTYSSNEELLAKVSVAKSGTYDLVFPSDYMVEIMIDRGLIEKIDKKQLNNLKNINNDFMGLEYDIGNDYSIPFLAASTVIAVNREVVKDEIKSYNDLLKNEYKNEIVLIDDQRIIIGMALLANGFDMNSVKESELRVAKDWLLKLKKNLKAFDSDSPKNFLISKEAAVAVLWNAEGALARMNNSNIEIIFPSEGVAVSVDNFVIPKGAKNKIELYKFINYILRPDVMKKIIESYPYKNINLYTDYLLGEKYLNNPAANISQENFKNGLFVENIGDKIMLYDQVWAEIK